MSDSIDRRSFLGGAALGVLGAAVARPAGAQTGAARTEPEIVGANGSPGGGLIIRERQPVNLEFPLSSLNGPITPTNQFFVRTHFPMPVIKAANWRLTVDGAVEKTLSLSYDDLRKLPAQTKPILLECAGNGRAHLVPKAKGLLWESGAVGTAEWTGVPLSTVLEMAGINQDAVEVILQGADEGEIADEPKSPGKIPFERSLPLKKAMQPEVFLAYQMNGKDLTREHGYPVRAIVGGWYGMAAVKWLSRISVTTSRYQGFWQSLEYANWQRVDGRPTLVPVTTIAVKASIARPSLSEAVPAGNPYRVFGVAWSGESEIAQVEVSCDSGKNWTEAKLLGESTPFAWRLWEHTWNVPANPGRVTLMARATDQAGHTQPVSHDRDRRNYMINFITPVEVEVV